MCSDIYVPMKLKELAVFLDVPREERPALEEVLNQLLAEGRIELSKRGKYSKAEGKYITGVFVGNARGFGFVTVEGEAEDIFISESAVNGAMHGAFVGTYDHEMVFVYDQFRFRPKQRLDKLVRRVKAVETVERYGVLHSWVMGVKSNDVVHTHVCQFLERQSAV